MLGYDLWCVDVHDGFVQPLLYGTCDSLQPATVITGVRKSILVYAPLSVVVMLQLP